MTDAMDEEIVTGMLEAFCRGASNEKEIVNHYKSILARNNKPFTINIDELSFSTNGGWTFSAQFSYQDVGAKTIDGIKNYNGEIEKLPEWNNSCEVSIHLHRDVDKNILDMDLKIETSGTYKVDIDIDKAMDGMATCVRN